MKDAKWWTPAAPEPESEWVECEVRPRNRYLGMYGFDLPFPTVGGNDTARFSQREDIPGYGGTLYEGFESTGFIFVFAGVAPSLPRPVKVRYRRAAK